MKKSALLLVLALNLSTAPGGWVLSAKSQTWNGKYNWSNGGRGPLQAVFTDQGDGAWKVAFYFRFDGKEYVYKGTAEGSLSSGKLEGKVKHRGRRWTFEGTVQDGEFRGSHSEIKKKGSFDTGTMTLRPRGK